MKGQAEIIGLMLIVVLLAIGFLLYVKFALTPEENAFRQQFESTEMGQTFINSLIKSDLDCGGQIYSVQKLLQLVATASVPGGCEAEDTLKRYITGVLKETFDAWGINYQLSIRRKRGSTTELLDERQLPPFTNSEYAEAERCSDAKRPRNPLGYAPIPIGLGGSGSVEVYLEECP